MDMNEIANYIRNNLRVDIRIKEDSFYMGENQCITVHVQLKLDDEVISEAEDFVTIDKS